MFSRGNHLNSPTLLPADLAIFRDWLTRETRILRAVVWLIDLRRGSFEEAQGGAGFSAVVVEAGVETFEGFGVME
ncbi:MAG: hypothetical protein RLZZ398_2183, partial [Verrucomicrobiota bacterium]